MRLFVASPLPDTVLVALERALDPVVSAHPEVRWSRPASWHVTLAFIGTVRPDEAGRIEMALAEAVPPAAFEASLGPLGAFPDTRNPHVVWVGLSVGAFPELAEAVRGALAAKAIPFDRKPFRAHVTVGRVGGRQPKGLRETAAAWISPRSAWTVDSYILYRSDLRADGALHTPLKTFFLPR